MIQIVLFILLSFFHISFQIELTLKLEIYSDNTDPIVFTRHSGGLMFISTRTKSLIYNLADHSMGSFDNYLSIFSRLIISSFVPQVYANSTGYCFIYYSSPGERPLIYVNDDFYPINDNNDQCKIQSLNSSTFFYGVPQFSTGVEFGLRNCEQGTKINAYETFSNQIQIIVPFIPVDSSNITVLYISETENIMKTYLDLNNFENSQQNTYNDLATGILHANSIALEEGGFIFCYNSSDTIYAISCEKMEFISGNLQRTSGPDSIITCPEYRNDYFIMYYLGNNRVLLACGLNPLHIQIVDSSLQTLESSIIIEDDRYISFDLTVMDTNRLFISGTLVDEDDGTYFKGGIYQIAINDEVFDSIDNINNYYALYFNSFLNLYVPCSSNCLSCKEVDEQESCTQCNTTNNYYLVLDEIQWCVDKSTNPARYEFYSSDESFHYCSLAWYKDSSGQVKCTATCPEPFYLDSNDNNFCTEKCSDSYLKSNVTRECVAACPSDYPYIIQDMCTSFCNENYPYLYDNNCVEICYVDRPYSLDGRCVESCPDGYVINDFICNTTCRDDLPYYYTNENNEKFCVNKCNEEYPYLITENKECVRECEVPFIFVFNSTCVSECPSLYKEVEGECISPIIITEEEEIVIDVPKEEVFEFIDVTSFIDEGKDLVGDDFVLQIFPLSSPIEEKNNISSIDLGECETILRRENHIPDNETLLVSKMDIQDSNAIIPKVKYIVYDSHGNKLDMKVCEGNDISISYPINKRISINYTKAESIADKGYDIYNPSDPFYNDKCSPFSEDGVDVVIKDRKKDYYIEVPFCDSSCSYGCINYTTGKVICNCSVNENEIKEQPTFDNFGAQLLDETNLMLFLCYKQALNIKKHKSNIGFYFIGAIFILQIILLISFLVYGLSRVYNKFKNILDNFYYNELDCQLTTKEVDVDNCNFKDAQKNEERSILKYFFLLLLQQIEIIRIFFFKNDFEIFSISLSLFLFSIASDYTMNALLFSDDIISERYDNKGSLNPLTTYTLTIVSNILGNIISIIAVKLTSFSPSLELLARERMKEKDYVEHLKKILKVIKCKLILYFIYVFTMMIVYLYFLCAFCSVYKASQWNWFTNGITSNVLSFLTTLGITLLITLCRYIGLHCNSERIYNISLYLNDNK